MLRPHTRIPSHPSLVLLLLWLLAAGGCRTPQAGSGWVPVAVLPQGGRISAPPLPASGRGLSCAGRTMLFNGAPLYLWSGEFPYYRLRPEDWQSRLELIRRAGIRFLTAYVPWNLHELREGSFDFTGRTAPQRDLLRFVRLVGAAGMYLILKPGPFICAEVRHGGIPDWLTDEHPEVIMQDWRGRPVLFRQDRTPLPAHLSPVYLRYVAGWYRALGRALSGLEAPKGPIVAVQLDNELIYSTSALANPFSWGYSPPLRRLYDRWREGRGEPPAEPPIPPQAPIGAAQWRRLAEWLDFKAWYGAEVLRRYRTLLQEGGITLPAYHNAGMLEDEPPMSFAALASVAWLGVNFWLHPHPMFSLASYTQGIRRLKQLEASQPGRPAIATELNWGWGDAGQYDFLTRYTMPYTRGTSVYPILDSDDAGQLGGKAYSNNPEPYPGAAPIDAAGRTTPAYGRLERLVRFTVAEGRRFTEARLPADVALGYWPPDNYPEIYTAWGGVPQRYLSAVFPAPVGANRFLQDFMEAFIRADMEYGAVNLQASGIRLERYPMLVVLSGASAGEDVRLRLLRYVRAGGFLVLLPGAPRGGTPAGAPPGGLLEGLELSAPRRLGRGEPLRWRGYPGLLRGRRLMSTLRIGSAGWEVQAVNREGQPVAAERRVGQGKVLVLGTYAPDGPFFSWLARREGLRPRYAWSDRPGVEAVPLVNPREGALYLFAINRTPLGHAVSITVLDPRGGEPLTVETTVAGHASSIVALQGGRLEAASLQEAGSSYVLVDGRGVVLPRGRRLDLLPGPGGMLAAYAEGGSELWADPDALALPLPARRPGKPGPRPSRSP